MNISPITPKTHPNAFLLVELIDGSIRYTPKVISVGLQEDMQDAYRACYEMSRPDECKDGINEDNYSAWLTSRDGRRATNRAAAPLILVQEDGSPSDDTVYYLVGRDDFWNSFNFTMRPLLANTNVPSASTANTENSPATAQTTNV